MINENPSHTGRNLEAKIDRAAKNYSNVKTLVVAAVSAVGAIFAAGIYYSELKQQLNSYVARIEALEKKQLSAQTDIDALKAGLSAEKAAIRSSINRAFVELQKIDNAGHPFANTEPANYGGGFNPTNPPGRCAVGQVVVGIQPYKATDGIRSIIFQCGAVPKVQVD